MIKNMALYSRLMFFTLQLRFHDIVLLHCTLFQCLFQCLFLFHCLILSVFHCLFTVCWSVSMSLHYTSLSSSSLSSSILVRFVLIQQCSLLRHRCVHDTPRCRQPQRRVVHGMSDLQLHFRTVSTESGARGCVIHTMEILPSDTWHPWPSGDGVSMSASKHLRHMEAW